MLCPHTGSIHSSLFVAGDLTNKVALGVSSLSTFPAHFSSNNNTLAVGFGASQRKKDDSYGLLFTLRSGSSSPPLLHWKCRLPEANMTAGLTVSPCGNYIVGGGASGNLHVWKSLGNGALLQTVKAHYQAVAVMTWSLCGRFLLTGGADGMVHAFSLLSLVEEQQQQPQASNTTIRPMRTWTQHQLSVTALVAMPSARLASSSQDGQVAIMEVNSGSLLASIQLPHPTTTLVGRGNRLYVSTQVGTIHVVDLDVYAMHQTTQRGATVVVSGNNKKKSHCQRVFGADKDDASNHSQLQGHNRAVTAMAVIDDDDDGGELLLVSGDETGTLRVWDLHSQTCVRVLQPWSTASTQKAGGHLVTSICVLRHKDDDNNDITATEGTLLFGGTTTATHHARQHHNDRSGVSNLVAPLQRFRQEHATPLPVPFLKGTHDNQSIWDISANSFSYSAALAKRRRRLQQQQVTSGGAPVGTGQDATVAPTSLETANHQDDDDEIDRLRRELAEAKSTIQRWEQVNHKLMARLQ